MKINLLKFPEEIIYDSWLEISENELNDIIIFAKSSEVMSYFFHLAWEGKHTYRWRLRNTKP